ncbi:hypothetical protein [Phenylobacterium immobile]|uniref:hypothetical protein n=1 Tax=Phenylobacterium immobile TaxID=21 RepID=UPI000A5C35F0|nr:hypothetical protein [Phenylobacterium immobile]
MKTMTPLSTLIAATLLAAAAPSSGAAQDQHRTAKEIQRDRQHLSNADRPARARTGEAEPAAAHEGQPRPRTAADHWRARQHLPKPQEDSN